MTRLPDFVGIGPGRAGSTWLYEVLSAHPSVRMADGTKEVLFFDRMYDKGLDWYASFFQGTREREVAGEISNRYIFRPEVARRMARDIPEATLLVCLRNPYDRLLSVATFMQREGFAVRSFEDALEIRPSLIDEGKYWSLLQPFRAHFEGQIHLVRFEELAHSPREATGRLYRALGVDADFFPHRAEEQVNQSVVPRFPGAGRMTKAAANTLRAVGAYDLLTALKRSRAVKGVFMKPARPAATLSVEPASRARMVRELTPDLERLGEWIGEDLVSAWTPAT